MKSTGVTVDRLLELRAAKPFLPFAFEMTAGSRHDVLKGTRFCTNGRGVMLFGPTGRIERFTLCDVERLRHLDVNEIAEHLDAGHFGAR